jgi:hypothetical protein
MAGRREPAERELKQEEEDKTLTTAAEDGPEELERLRQLEKMQTEVGTMQKIAKLRGQLASQELTIEKMRRENEKIKEKTRTIHAAARDHELDMAMRLSQMETSGLGRRGLSEAEIDVKGT